jgi:hypothetical protein
MISGAFGAALAAHRDRFNARMREARRRTPALAPDVVAVFLRECAAPLVEAVAAQAPAPARVDAVVDAVYEAALALAARKSIGPGARSQLLAQAWSGTFAAFAPLVAAQPAPVLGMLSNAIVYLEALPGSRPRQWLAEMAALAPRIESAAQLAVVGQIAAWRAGAAHFREGALGAADGLPAALALAALGAPADSDLQALLLRMIDDPWWRGAGDAAREDVEIGAFTGFGGAFATPPQIRAAPDRFVVRAGERYFILMADAYGAVLQPAGADDFDRAGAGQVAHTLDGESLQVGARRIACDLPAAGLALCANRSTVAIVSPFTHAIRLLRR